MSASYATGRVAGGGNIGGLVGDSNGWVVASWTDTVVTGGDDVGGVVGENSGAILSVYALGTVSGTSDAHGVVGYTENQQDLGNVGVYYNSDRHQVDHFPYSRSLLALKDPAGYSGIYAKWNVDTDRLPAGVYSLDDPWDFGTSNDLPALKADRNGDGIATWREFGGQRRGGRDHDRNDNNLIEVSNLAQLNAIRYDPAGVGTPSNAASRAFRSPAYNMGCATKCQGYELTTDLDFDTKGRAGVGPADAYWNGGAGWDPIGNADGAYTGEFHGNGRSISNLYIDREQKGVGLFGKIGGSAYVHHVGLPNANVTNTIHDVGALVGFMQGNQTRVSANFATGTVTGGGQTGGLVGSNQGYVRANWAEVSVHGTKHVGGLVGHNGGEVSASYALGAVFGDSRVHGVVGLTDGGVLNDVYFRSDINPDIDDIYAKTKAELATPTDYTGIYANWDVDLDGDAEEDAPWDFWTKRRYPRLKADRNGDGVFTRAEFRGQNPGDIIGDLRDYDTDNDNLIEVTNLGQLDAIRHDLNGDGSYAALAARQYEQVYPNPLVGMGCPNTCQGYELTADLDFDTKGRAGVGPADPYWNGGAGWEPIGNGSGAYTGEFHGNGRSISNLYIDREQIRVGLFGQIGGSAYIHHVGLPNVDITTTGYDVGALVGFMQGNQTRVSASYATGSVVGGGQTGGLVGSNQGYVKAAWTNVTVEGAKHVGGVVGSNEGSVHSVYALGTVTGDNLVHGVVGHTYHQTDLATAGVYYNADLHLVSSPPYSRTTAELQSPTDYADIYANWNVDLDGDGTSDDAWDFGTAAQYPKLKADRNSDGVSTVGEFHGQQRRPSLVSAETSTDGTEVTITFTVPVQVSPLLRWFIEENGLPGAFLFVLSVLNVEVDGTWPIQDSATVSGNNTVTVRMREAITSGQDVVVRYDNLYARQAAEILMDQDGNPMANFGPAAVTNRSTEDDFDGPHGITMNVRELTITEGESDSYTIALSAQPSGDVTVGLSVIKPNSVTISTDFLYFTSDNWNTPQTVTITSAADENDYGYWVTIVHSASRSGYTGQDSIKILMEE